MSAPGSPRACVIGWPVRHSRSPMVHGYWLNRLGIKGSYVLAEVPQDEFSGFVARLADNGFVGGNVTIPFKEAAYRLCEVPTARASRLGAVNTLWLSAGRLHGDNTDVAGFVGNLDEAAPGWDGQRVKAVVLGAGGAARAIVQALVERSAERIVLVNRTAERARSLMDAFADVTQAIEAAAWTERAAALVGADLLVNTTSLGMDAQPPLDLDLDALPSHACIADLVYVPVETPLIVAARRRGLRAVDGVGMLLHQAVPGFERWFGARPQVTQELRRLVVADIARSRAAGN